MQQGMYHCSVKSVSRSQGRSATAAAAYRAGVEITDERTGEVYDYTRKRGVIFAEILTPEGVNIDRETLWNQAETAEKRKDAKVAREWEIALPHELDKKEHIILAREFAGKLIERYGIAVDVCIHEPRRDSDQRNTHAHLLTTTRQITSEGLTAKTRQLDSPKTSGVEIDTMRGIWADCCNKAYERAGLNIYTDHRSLKNQGIDREPTKHLGPEATQMERRGVESDRGNINREIAERQAEIERLKKALISINHTLEKIQKEQIEKKQETTTEKKLETALEKTQRKYNERTTKSIINYIQNEPDINKVKQLYFLVQSDATKKDLQAELQKHAEYRTYHQKYISCKNEYDNALYEENIIKREIQNLGIFERAKYKLGKHELYENEEINKARKLKAQIQYTQSQKELSDIQIKLSGSGGEVYQQVTVHNRNATEAQKTYQAIMPYYRERTKQEMERQQEQRKLTRKRQRGGHER